MKGNRILVVLSIIVVLLVGVFVWLMIKFAMPSKKLAPYFPNITNKLDNVGDWQSAAFQPIFEELVDASSGGYLRVSYVNSKDGAVVEEKVYLAQQVPYINEANVQEVVTRAELRGKLKKGAQFGVYYLSKFPTDPLQTSHCQGQGTEPVECLFAFLKQGSDNEGENIFYPLALYQTLKEK